MNSSITVFINDGAIEPNAITVNLSDSIRILDESIKEKGQRVFYCNGSIILPAFSFHYFDIKDGDHIFVIRSKEQRLLMQNKTSSMFNNIQSMKRRLSCSHNKSSAYKSNTFTHTRDGQFPNTLSATFSDMSLVREASRISDIVNTHYDSYISSSRRECHCMPNTAGQSIVEQKTTPTSLEGNRLKQQTFIGSAMLPSSEALPQLWGTF